VHCSIVKIVVIKMWVIQDGSTQPTYLELGNWAKLIENDKNKYIMKDSNAWCPMTLSIPAFDIATLDIMT
jgi:hypothetical protein